MSRGSNSPSSVDDDMSDDEDGGDDDGDDEEEEVDDGNSLNMTVKKGGGSSTTGIPKYVVIFALVKTLMFVPFILVSVPRFHSKLHAISVILRRSSQLLILSLVTNNLHYSERHTCNHLYKKNFRLKRSASNSSDQRKTPAQSANSSAAQQMTPVPSTSSSSALQKTPAIPRCSVKLHRILSQKVKNNNVL